jgi:ribose transport system permease protein
MRVVPTRRWLEANRWVWSFIAAALVWALTVASVEGRGAAASLGTALGFATFYAIVGIGQMLVISTGGIYIDLSIPSVMMLAGYLSMGTMGARDAGLLPGIAVALVVGAAAGVANVILIRVARIPSMIATLASGFIMQSMTIAYSRHSTAKPAPILLDFSLSHMFGIPTIAVIFVMFSIGVGFVLARTTFGRSVLATGQNARAAYLAGIAIPRTIAAVYIISGVLAAIAGLLLAAYSGGASLNMSEDFLLMSIAVVVLGGTSISGGRAVVAGVWGASLFLYLIVAMLNVLGVGAGLRYVVTGIIIIVVLALSDQHESA